MYVPIKNGGYSISMLVYQRVLETKTHKLDSIFFPPPTVHGVHSPQITKWPVVCQPLIHHFLDVGKDLDPKNPRVKFFGVFHPFQKNDA